MPQDALKQFSDTETFRKANDIEVLYDTMDIEAYESAQRLVGSHPPLAGGAHGTPAHRMM